MIRHPPRSTRPDTLLPCTSLFRSTGVRAALCPGNGMNPPDDGVRAVEAVLFATEAPLTLDAIRAHVGDGVDVRGALAALEADYAGRSEEHTSELQSLMRISYAVFCLKKKNKSGSY